MENQGKNRPARVVSLRSLRGVDDIIVVKLFGGLGNQMFQYAFGMAAAKILERILLCDTSYFSRSHDSATYREYGLNTFGLSVQTLDTCPPRGFWRTALARLRNEPSWEIIHERQPYHYDPSVFSALPTKRIPFFDGYWQSHRYFSAFRSHLLADFHYPGHTEPVALMDEGNAVAVHIRRGDYVADSRINEHHGVCPLSYYREAMREIANEHPDAVFHVFSDDPQWCRNELKPEYPTRFMDTSRIPAADLTVMSHCRHFIISNSTFGWWAAWLGESADKIVIAPAQWLSGSNPDLSDLIPADWRLR